MTEPAAIGLDLGTTRIKAGLLGKDGHLVRVASVGTPALAGADPIHESDPGEYLAAAAKLLAEATTGLPTRIPLGIACQRSTFLLWERDANAPITPMISWLDRRARPWCDRRVASARDVALRTGLRLSPHYAGPKLATLLEERPDLGDRLESGQVLFGNVDAWALCRWGHPDSHETDPTMAARTLLVDPGRAEWSDEMLRFFGVPRACLPEIHPTVGRAITLDSGPLVTAMVADQASGAFALLGEGRESVLVNLGTGGFVLRIAEEGEHPPDGYLRGPAAPAVVPSPHLFLLEGTINGLGDSVGRGPTSLPEEDPTPDAFCLPDGAGVGSPYWLSHIPRTFSPAALALDPAQKRRVLLEGILFRVREIVEAFSRSRPPRRTLLSGGLARDPFLAQGLASCLGTEIEIVEEPEATLLGAACLAAGLPPPKPAITRVTPNRAGSYLSEKFGSWRSWIRDVVG